MGTKVEDLERLVDETISEFARFDMDPDRIREDHAEDPVYLRLHRHEYIRTLRDVVEFSERHEVKEVLEIGAFFGLVSICLAKLGFQVCAADIPEYMEMPEQQERFGRHGVEIASVRLQDFVLPFGDGRFDAIIMCEVLEHLNFNPLPLIKEINRIGSQDSLFYLSLPNHAAIGNRLRLLRGGSAHEPVETFFQQLDPEVLEIANGHWREYTGAEVREILERMGYEIERQYFFGLSEVSKPTLRNRIARFIYRSIPDLKENQTTLAIRRRRTDIEFAIPRTVHPTLGSL